MFCHSLISPCENISQFVYPLATEEQFCHLQLPWLIFELTFPVIHLLLFYSLFFWWYQSCCQQVTCLRTTRLAGETSNVLSYLNISMVFAYHLHVYASHISFHTSWQYETSSIYRNSGYLGLHVLQLFKTKHIH